MHLSGLLDLLPRLPAFRAWLETLATPPAEPTPQALLAAARPFVVAGARMQRAAPIVLITARSEMAQQLCEQLEVWLPPQEEGAPPVYHFAEPDALPYERIPWSSATRQKRLTALAALQNRSAAPPIIVASARALMQKTLPARELRLALRTIKVGGVCAWSRWRRCGRRPATLPSRWSRSRACLRGAAASSTSGRPTCPRRCASTSLATRWRACASSTRPASARSAPSRGRDRAGQRGAEQVRPGRAGTAGRARRRSARGGECRARAQN
jgi:hypothetical protein